LNLKELKEILQLLDDKEITEFELEEEGIKLRIRKSPAALEPPAVGPSTTRPASAPRAEAVPTVSHATVSLAPEPAEDVESGLLIVKSPIVGTFYRAPDPTAAPFVNVGDKIRVGQVLCIIEAMKLMNEIEAEVAGEIVKIHHDSGQPVQYGEPLFVIRPDR
jgi:acetyl-CoA carboxylase biotin carboxyl carrier protein